MTIGELGSLGEFVGSMAVLVTLIYLAIQTRISRQVIQSQAIALSAGTTASGVYTLASNPATALAWTRGIDGEALKEEEAAVFRMLLLGALVSLDGAIISAQRFENSELNTVWSKAIRSYWASPAFRKVWESGYLQANISNSTIEFVEAHAP